MKKIYLDNASTKRPLYGMSEYLKEIIDNYYGNPNSSHSVGNNAKVMIETVRDIVAGKLNVESQCIYFTPSGSASNTLAIKGYCDENLNATILYSPISHKSIIKCINKKFYSRSHKLIVNDKGFIDVKNLEFMCNLLYNLDEELFVVIDYANSEIGTIQNVKKIIEIVHKYNGIVYLDCTAIISTLIPDLNDIDADMIGFSGHKIGALKGIGILYKKENINLSPLIYGTQEHGLVGGTYNTIGIASLGYALNNYHFNNEEIVDNRNYIAKKILLEIEDCKLIGSDFCNRLNGNLNICFKYVNASELTRMLDDFEIQVSTGSACNSGTSIPSYVLKEIGLSDDDALSCIRISLSGEETFKELDYVVDKIKYCVNRLRVN